MKPVDYDLSFDHSPSLRWRPPGFIWFPATSARRDRARLSSARVQFGSMPFALVTGTSRGVGRGIAIELAAARFHVFATGRTVTSADLLPSIQRIQCDHLI